MLPICILSFLLFALILTTFVHDLQPRVEAQLLEFIEYHLELGVTHFMLYDRSGYYRPFLDSFYTPDVITHVTWGGIAQNRSLIYSKYAVFYHYLSDIAMRCRYEGYYDQILALNHCLFHNRNRSKWVGMFDIDEWVTVPKRQNVVSMLNNEIKLNPQLGNSHQLFFDK